MIELFTALGMSELGAYIVSVGSPVLSLLALVFVCIKVLGKVTVACSELKNNAQVNELIAELKKSNAENQALKKMNKKLLQEISKKIDVIKEDE